MNVPLDILALELSLYVAEPFLETILSVRQSGFGGALCLRLSVTEH
jgi:hypothetical protein